RVTNSDQLGGRLEKHREGAFGLSQNFRYGFAKRAGPGTRHAMQNNFSVGGGGKDRAFAFKLASLLTREGEVAVVANGDLAVLASNQKRLGFANRNFAGS